MPNESDVAVFEDYVYSADSASSPEPAVSTPAATPSSYPDHVIGELIVAAAVYHHALGFGILLSPFSLPVFCFLPLVSNFSLRP